MDIKQQLEIAQQILADTPLPAMPSEVLELQALFASTEFPDFGEVARIIGRNTVLSGELLKLANDPRFVGKKAQPVQNIRAAVDRLGSTQLQNLVVGLAFKSVVKNMAFETLIEHSFDVARVACELSTYIVEVRPDKAYLAGLFHNSGAIMLASRFAKYEKIFFNTLTNYYSGVHKEELIFHVNHGVFGLLVAKKWNLDADICQLVMMHHQKDLHSIENDKVRLLVALIQLANCIVSEVSFGSYIGTEIKEMMEGAQEVLMIESSVINEVRKSVIINSLIAQI